MQFPLTFVDVFFMFSINSIILLITSELTYANYGLSNLPVDRKKLQIAAIATGVIFLFIISLEIITRSFF